MPIKHTKKDIAAETQDVVTGIDKNYNYPIESIPVNNSTKNFTKDLIIKLKKQDQYNEEDEGDTHPGRDLEPYISTTSSDRIVVPLTALVTQEHLSENYYTKAEVDAHVKPHYEVLESIDNLPTAAEVRTAGHQNYIFLIPYSSDIDDGDPEHIQEGYFIEYMYVISGTDTSTERMERIGSTQIDLAPYVTGTELSNILNNYIKTEKIVNNLTTDDATKVLSAKQGKVLNDNKAATTHKHGQITSDGKVGISNAVLVTNNNGLIIPVYKIGSNQVDIPDPYLSIGSTANNLESLLSDIDSAFSNVNTSLSSLSNYLLKSEIYTEIWGTNQNGFRSMQIAEDSNSPSKNYKLGDYIYDKVYTKSQIDDLIGTLANLQQNTLNIL